jgi:putative toxin-antitoxin system antitoxin component (TIGR02293 family)
MSDAAAVLGIRGSSDPMHLHDRVARGFPVSSLRRAGSVAGVLSGQLAGLLGVHLRTLTRAERRRGTRLDPVLSDRLYRFAGVVARAGEVFENRDAARRWLAAPQHGLGGRTPLALLGTEAGTQEVRDLLGRIEDGNLA